MNTYKLDFVASTSFTIYREHSQTCTGILQSFLGGRCRITREVTAFGTTTSKWLMHLYKFELIQFKLLVFFHIMKEASLIKVATWSGKTKTMMVSQHSDI